MERKPTAGKWCRVLGFSLALSGAVSASANWQDHAGIVAAAESAVRATTAELAGKVVISAAAADPRLRLPACGTPLTAAVGGSGAPQGRRTAEVRCAGPKPWKIYIPVAVTQVRPVVVAARPLARDAILTAGDVRLAEREVTTLGYGFLAEPADAIGQRLRRGAADGEVLTPASVQAPVLIRRGQQVTVEARSGPLAVQMSGVARGGGALGDTIEVENVASGRIVQAVVRSAKSVEVLLQ